MAQKELVLEATSPLGCLSVIENRLGTAGKMTDKEKKEVLKAEIRKVTSKRPAWESIQEFVILPGPLSPDDGTLTRTMKPRRQVILQKYSTELEKLYLLLK